MFCYNCGCALTELPYCPNCGTGVSAYKKIIRTSNRLYNDGLEKAKVRDLSGAVVSLKESLWCNKYNTDARNLLGLVYYEMGEMVAALSEWVISQNFQQEDNRASILLNQVQNNAQVQNMNKVIQKYNTALNYIYNGDLDVAQIQLKSVLKMNPHYIRACQLLALLYIQDQKWETAGKLLARCQTLDKNNLTTLKYLQEVRRQLDGTAANEIGIKKVHEKTGVIAYQDGNETVIQPARAKNPGIDTSALPAGILNLVIGLVVGASLIGFLVLPARVQATRQQGAAEVKTISEQLDARNAEIADLNSRITTMEAEEEELQNQISEYQGKEGQVSASDALFAAAEGYINDAEGSDTEAADQFMLITDEDLEKSSEAYRKLYNTLGSSMSYVLREKFRDAGMAAHDAEEPDYAEAINQLENALNYYDADTSGITAVMYTLADSYYRQYTGAEETQKSTYSAGLTRASQLLEQILSDYPDSDVAEDAQELLNQLEELKAEG